MATYYKRSYFIKDSLKPQTPKFVGLLVNIYGADEMILGRSF